MVRQLYESRSVTVQEIAQRFNVSRGTIYKTIKSDGTEQLNGYDSLNDNE